MDELQLDDHRRSIARYYDECWSDYRRLWINNSNLGMHFGYWDEHTRNHAHSLIRTNEVMADSVNITSSDRVLDAGCGVGGSCIWLARERGATVVGITIPADQVRLGRRYVERRGLQDQISLFQRDYRDTGFPSESFDVVWACESVGHCPDQRDFLAEAYRLLKPGGRLIVRDIYLRRPPADAYEERLMKTWYSAWVLPGIPIVGQFVSWVEEAGFTGVHAEDITATAEPSGRRLYRMAVAALPIETLLHRIRLRTDVQHTNVLGPVAAWRGYKRGLWTATMTSARRPDA